jgi:hypothetical protein
MNTNDIVLAIDAEIAQLQKVKALLTDSDLTARRRPGRPVRLGTSNQSAGYSPGEPSKRLKPRTMSAEGRAKIAAAQRARWARSKKGATLLAQKVASKSAKKIVKRNTAGRTTQARNTRTLKKTTRPNATPTT